MNQDTTFTYRYSAKENKEVQDIRRKYLPCEESKMEELKRLDDTVQRAGMLESLCAGIGGAFLFGLGLCLAMQVFGIGIVGLFMAIINYPIYKSILGARRKKFADKIIALSDKIMKG